MCTRVRAPAHHHVPDKNKKHVLRAELKVCNAPYRSNRTLVANNRFAPLYVGACEHGHELSATHMPWLISMPEKLILHTILSVQSRLNVSILILDAWVSATRHTQTHCRREQYCGQNFLLKPNVLDTSNVYKAIANFFFSLYIYFLCSSGISFALRLLSRSSHVVRCVAEEKRKIE